MHMHLMLQHACKHIYAAAVFTIRIGILICLLHTGHRLTGIYTSAWVICSYVKMQSQVTTHVYVQVKLLGCTW